MTDVSGTPRGLREVREALRVVEARMVQFHKTMQTDPELFLQFTTIRDVLKLYERVLLHKGGPA